MDRQSCSSWASCTASQALLAVPVLKPSELLRAWFDEVANRETTIGVIFPDERQLEQTQQKWSDRWVSTEVGSPYESTAAIASAAKKFDAESNIVLLDCIGYTPEMKTAVERETGAGVLLARSVLAKTIAELL